MILELSCIVILHEDDFLLPFYFCSNTWIDWKQELHDHESILRTVHDEVFYYEAIARERDDHLLCHRIDDFISLYSFFFEEVIELMCALDSHLPFHLWILARRTIFIMLIARRYEITVLCPDSDIGRDMIIGECVALIVFRRSLEKLPTIDRSRRREWIIRTMKFGELLIREEDDDGLVFRCDILCESREEIRLFMARRTEYDMSELSECGSKSKTDISLLMECRSPRRWTSSLRENDSDRELCLSCE